MTFKRFAALMLSLLMLLTVLPELLPAAQAKPSEAGCAKSPTGRHAWGGRPRDAWCDYAGGVVWQCSYCGKTIFEEDTPALGHNWGEWTTTKEPSCTEKGSRTRTCKRCQKVETQEIAARGHYFPNPWTTISEPTCTEVGHEMNTCVRVNRGVPCGYEWWREIPALGHDWGEWHVIKTPTAEEDGIEQRECSRCGITEQRPLTLEDYADSASLSLSVSFDKDRVYKADETVTFHCTVMNNGNVPLWIEAVYMEFQNDDDMLESSPHEDKTLGPGESLITTVTYTCTQEDEDRRYVSATLFARGLETDKLDTENYVVSNFVPAVINLDDFMDYELIVGKTERFKPENGLYYTAAETITYKIVVTNRFDRTLHNVTVEDIPDGLTASIYTLGVIEELPPYASRSFETLYTVTEEDCARGYHLNLAYAQGEDTNGTTAEVSSPCGVDKVKVEKEEISTPANGAFYTEGETIDYLITVSNLSKADLNDVWVYDIPENWEIGYALDSGITLAPGEQRQYVYHYTVIAGDCDMGFMRNQASVSWEDQDHPTGLRHTESNFVTSPCGRVSELLITKAVTSAPANGEYYVDGETITYVIEVWNLTDYPLYDLEVYDNRNDNEYARSLLGSVPVFGAHGHLKYNYEHAVDVDDIANSPYPNSATAFWYSGDPTGADVTASPKREEKSNVVECPCGKPKAGVRLSKYEKSTPANGEYYVEGESVRYYVVIQNNTDGHVFVSDFTDTLSPIGDFFGDPYSWGELYPDEVNSAEYSYTINDLDVLVGTKSNAASIVWQDEEGNTFTALSNTVTVPTGKGEEPRDEVTLEKRVLSVPANGYAYEVAEQIIYEVVITNNYHTIAQDVEISDPLKGSGENSVIGHIDTLHMHESYSYIYVYTVTAEDAEAGYVLNQATAIWTDGRTREQHTVNSNIVTVPVMHIVPPERVHVYLAKFEDSAPANGLYYVEGETVRYGVYFVNDGDGDVYDVRLHDDMFNPDWSAYLGVPGTVKAGETSSTFYFEHEVTAEEAILGHITNQAAAMYRPEGDASDEGEMITSNVVIVLTGFPEPEDEPVDFELHKTVVSTSANAGYYVKGETVAYLITLVNNSDLPLFIDQTWDQLWNAGLIWEGDLGTGTVNPHDSVSFGYTHQVTQEDVDNGLLTNVVVMDFFTQKADDHIEYFTAMDSAEVLCKEGPEPPEEPDYPVVIKYETSHPANWSYYTENEVVEYDVWVYNYTGRDFSNIRGYDILLDTPGFYFGSMPTLDATPAKFHIYYTVTGADVIMGSIYNIAWVTMYDDTYENEFTVYSNDVTVPTDGIIDPPEKRATVCDYQLLASGEGAYEYMNVYCAEHAGVHAATEKLLGSASSPEETSVALETAVGLWQRSLDSQYRRLIDAAEGDLKTSLENDRRVFDAYTEAYRARLQAEGLEADSVNRLLIDTLCDRVCELCCTAGTAPQARKDVQSAGIRTIERRSANECTCTLDRSHAAYFTKSLNVCNRHTPLLKAVSRLFAAAGEDERMKAVAWDKEKAYWLAELNGQYDQMIKARPELGYCLTVEHDAYIAAVSARMSLYEAYYSSDTALISELGTRMCLERALSLCK